MEECRVNPANSQRPRAPLSNSHQLPQLPANSLNLHPFVPLQPALELSLVRRLLQVCLRLLRPVLGS